ncbi:MAG: asparaginase [Ekhidna sp.]|uniref:asparaginase n=1 Tax=Ekhidna sp. TaxID=2608089 RepID=UPI0032EC3575
MKYKIVNINETGDRSVLIIYTGGTFGMVQDATGALAPFNFGKVVDRVPELRQLGIKLTVISFPKPIDSSNILVQDWKDMAYIIEENYAQYDAFVILHGTDTMAYSSSMLSYMLDGLNKPVIFTGAQMPIGSIRSDARENLITALEIAAAHNEGRPIISEVCVYFNHLLLRGSRAQKLRSSTFAAFESENYPVLAEAGIEIEYNYAALKPFNPDANLVVRNQLDPHVTILKIFPGITEAAVRATILEPSVKGIVLESFGSGNIMKFDWFINCLKDAIAAGKIILNVSQCVGGQVEQGKYETSKNLTRIGVLSGGDITTEAAITKLMFLLGEEKDENLRKQRLTHSLAGEMDHELD